MKTRFSPQTIRKNVVSIAALTIFSLSLVPSAAVAGEEPEVTSLFAAEAHAETRHDVEAVYREMKSQSRAICGDADIHIAGGVRDSQQVQECFEGTLTAAVLRLDNPEVSEIHFQ